MTKARLEAFSDGVIAILITIMVLELHVPHEATWSALGPLVPIFLTYVLSFVFLGIYWNNHHHMLHAADRINGKVLWANLHLLFWLSLIPFVTGWMGQNHFAPIPTRRLRHRHAVRGDRVLHPGAYARRRAGTRFEAGARHRPRSQRQAVGRAVGDRDWACVRQSVDGGCDLCERRADVARAGQANRKAGAAGRSSRARSDPCGARSS